MLAVMIQKPGCKTGGKANILTTTQHLSVQRQGGQQRDSINNRDASRKSGMLPGEGTPPTAEIPATVRNQQQYQEVQRCQ